MHNWLWTISRAGSTALMLAGAASAQAADCVDTFLAEAKGLAAAEAVARRAGLQTGTTFPVLTFNGPGWELTCDELGQGASPVPDCASNKPAVDNLLDVLSEARKWQIEQGYNSLALKQVPGGAYKAKLSRMDLWSLTSSNPGFYDKHERYVAFSAADVFCAVRERATAGELLYNIVGHELFHAYSATTVVGRSLYLSQNKRENSNWIFEGLAEGVGVEFAQTATKQPEFNRPAFYNIPLSSVTHSGYDRGHFWYWLGQLRKRGKASTLFQTMLAQGEGFETTPDDPGITWLERGLRGAGSSLHATYGELIAQHANEFSYYSHDASATGFELTALTDTSGKYSKTFEIERLAASAYYLVLRPSLMMKPAEAKYPGSVLIDVTLDIDRKGAPAYAGLAVEAEWRNDENFRRTFVPEGNKIELLSRVTNIRKDNPVQSVPIEVRLNAAARQINLSGPRCMKTSSTQPITIEYADGAGGELPKLGLRAKRGTLTGLEYTAPATPGKVVLEVLAYADASATKYVTFQEVDVGTKACGITMTIYDGETIGRMVYDATSDATRIEGSDGEVGYADANGIVGRDDETGQWVRAPFAAIPMIAPVLGMETAATMAKGMPMLAHRGPLNMVEAVKLMRRDAVKTYGLRPKPAACPTGGTGCVQYDLPIPGESASGRLVFSRDGDPVAFGVKGEEGYAEFTYTDDPVVVPPAGRVM